jgi:hypothetical protein
MSAITAAPQSGDSSEILQARWLALNGAGITETLAE